MKKKFIQCMLCLIVSLLIITQVWQNNIINSDSSYSIKIAVTINKDDHIMGKLEYSNNTPQYPLQLVTFNPIAGVIYAEPYLFELIEKTIISKNVHRIKCRSINDKYGSDKITGTIDFTNELKPKIHLENEFGRTYINNITEKGKKIYAEYLPNIWLGR